MSKTLFSLPVLYKIDSKQKERFWKVYILKENPAVVIREDGVQGEKVKEPTLREIKGNTLRTAEEQALKEAKKMWLSKIDQFFKPSSSDIKGNIIYQNTVKEKLKQNSSNTNIEISSNKKENTDLKLSLTQIPVMLAKDFFNSKMSNLTPFTKKLINTSNINIFIQPKLDGIRCISYYDSKKDEVILRSRNMKEFSFLDHIKESLYNNFFKKNPSLIFDGELYFHDNNTSSVERYQFISSVVKINRLEPHLDENTVEYWVFDIIDTSLTFSERYKLLQKLFKNNKSDYLVLTPTKCKFIDEINSEESILKFIKDIFDHFISINFEGLMIRNGDSLYKNGRSSDLIKYKLFKDEEWRIVDAKTSTGGNQDGSVIWILEDVNDPSKSVEAKQIGDVITSRNLFKNKEKYLGKLVNIRFNDKTIDGIPRFPRAITFVEDKNTL